MRGDIRNASGQKDQTSVQITKSMTKSAISEVRKRKVRQVAMRAQRRKIQDFVYGSKSAREGRDI